VATPGLSASPSLAGIQKVRGATSQYIAYAIAGWFVLLACVPKVGAVLLALPLPIIGAALVFNGASMLVGGIQIVMSRPRTMRNTFIIGISLLFCPEQARVSRVLRSAALMVPCLHRFDSVDRSGGLRAAQSDFPDRGTSHRGHSAGARRSIRRSNWFVLVPARSATNRQA
jgi:hypothetical protein